MSFFSLDVVCILIYVITFSLYVVFVEKIPKEKRVVFLFWVNAFVYLGFVVLYLYRSFIVQSDKFALEQLVHNVTIFNAPLYIALAAATLGGYLLFNKLIAEYSVTEVIAFSEVTLLFTSIAFFLLGDPFSLKVAISIAIIFTGGLFFLFESLVAPNIKKSFSAIPKGLWIGIGGYTALMTLIPVIRFILTQKTTVDMAIVDHLKLVYPFSFQSTFFFTVGARFFIMLAYFFYVNHYRHFHKDTLTIFKEHFGKICLISAISFIAVYANQEAYLMAKDKDMLQALDRLTIPTIVIFNWLFLKQPITMPKVIGSVIIVSGGLFLLF